MPLRRVLLCFVAFLTIGQAFAAAPRRVSVNGAAVPTDGDLAVTKFGPATAAAGSDLPYSITVTANGPADSAMVSLVDPLPAGMTFVSLVQNTGPAFSCSTPMPGTNGTSTCTIPLLAVGASADFTLIATVDVMSPPGTTFTNVATVSQSNFDPNDENNSYTAATTVPGASQADVFVTKNGPSSAAANTDVAYTITVSNAGPDVAQGVSLTDTLPGTMTFVSLSQTSGPAFSCMTPGGGAGGTVTCTIGMMAMGSTASFTLTGNIPAGTMSGTMFSNAATVSETTADPSDENNSSTTDLVVTDADPAISKSGPATGVAGQQITWTINLTNNGSGAATNIFFGDTLPAGTTFASFVQGSGPTAGCSSPAPGASGSISCSLANLPAATTASFTLTANILPSVASGTSLTNTASINSSDGDANPGNNSTTSSATITTSADVSVSKTGPPTATAGANITYTVTVTSAGPSNAANVSLTDTVPANTTFVSESQTSGPTFACTNPPAGATGTTTCTISTLAPGATAVFSIVVKAAAGAAAATVTNTATVTSTTTDSNMGNNASPAMTTVQGSADVSVTKSVTGSGTAGSNLTYTITVTNNGPSDASTVVLTDATPANETFVSQAQAGGPMFNCTAPSPGGTGNVVCSIATLTAGSVAVFTIVDQITPTTTNGTMISNTATVTSTTADPVMMNNSATTTTTVGASADLSIVKTAAAGPYGTGNTLTYTITVSNSGPSSATGVSVTDVLPAGTTFVSATPTQGTCAGTTTVTCNLGTLANATSASITLRLTLPPTSGPIANTAAATSSTADPNPANNTSTSTVTVVPVAAIPTFSPMMLLMFGVALAAAGFMNRR